MGSDHFIRQLAIILWSTGRLAVWLAVFAAIFVPIERFFALHAQKISPQGMGGRRRLLFHQRDSFPA